MPKSVTVILANGEFPRRGGAAEALLASAARVVACDGAAAAYRRRFGRDPDFIVGDLDSLRGRFAAAEIVRVPEQETNDLEKAVRFCRSRGWRKPVVVGAGGVREDHAIGNAFRALALGVEMVSDYGRFVPVAGTRRFRLAPGTAVSVFAPDPRTVATSRGLAWPLDGIRFDSLYRATLNRASAPSVTVTADRPILVYFAS